MVGLFDYRGLFNLSGHSAKIIFSGKKELPVFSKVMSLNRFQILISHLCFDNTQTKKELWKSE